MELCLRSLQVCILPVITQLHLTYLWLWGKERFDRKTTESNFQIMVSKSPSCPYGVQQTGLNKQMVNNTTWANSVFVK